MINVVVLVAEKLPSEIGQCLMKIRLPSQYQNSKCLKANLLILSIIVKFQAVPSKGLLDERIVYTLSYSVGFG